MGLDMYLTKKTWVGNQYAKEPSEMVQVVMPATQDKALFPVKNKIKSERVSEIIESVGYWRKANAIHKWFIDNVATDSEGDGDYLVSFEQLQKLLGICTIVLEKSKLVKGKIKNGQKNVGGEWVDIMEDGKYIEDDTTAKALLPTESGFFFGSTDYNEWYLQDVEETKKIIEAVLAEGDHGDIYYHASW
jgi:hypothetical protein